MRGIGMSMVLEEALTVDDLRDVARRTLKQISDRKGIAAAAKRAGSCSAAELRSASPQPMKAGLAAAKPPLRIFVDAPLAPEAASPCRPGRRATCRCCGPSRATG
jgi:hypothetical protein